MKGQNKKILFVCTGNYYRSRFAEVYFNHFAPKGWVAVSAGFNVSNPDNMGDISNHTVEELSRLNIDFYKNKKPEKINVGMIEKADMVIAMNREEHEKIVKNTFPHYECKFNYWTIKDLYEDKPITALGYLKNKLDTLIKELVLES